MKDINGKKLAVGDRVRIVGVPDLTGMRGKGKAQAKKVFEKLLGTYKRVAGFDRRGNAEFWFRILGGPQKGMHWVAMETHLLRRPVSRLGQAS